MEKVTRYNQSLSLVTPLPQMTTCTQTTRWRGKVMNLTQTRKLEKRQEESSENSYETEEEDHNPWKLILNDVFQKMENVNQFL